MRTTAATVHGSKKSHEQPAWVRFMSGPVSWLLLTGLGVIMIQPTTVAGWTLLGAVVVAFTAMVTKREAVKALPVVRLPVYFFSDLPLIMVIWHPDRTWWKIGVSTLALALLFEAIHRSHQVVRHHPRFAPVRELWDRFGEARYRGWHATSILQWSFIIAFILFLLINISLGIWETERERPTQHNDATLYDDHVGERIAR